MLRGSKTRGWYKGLSLRDNQEVGFTHKYWGGVVVSFWNEKGKKIDVSYVLENVSNQ